jgi:protein SCO1/2
MASCCWTARSAAPVPVLAALLLAACGDPLPGYGNVSRFSLTDQSGAAFSSDGLEGKVWVANFIFTNCAGPCPRMSTDMARLATSFAAEPRVHFVSFTVDPERDTPPVLAAYARRFRAGERWHLLTGEPAELHRIKRRDFQLGDVAPGVLEHSTRFVLVDGKGRIRGYYRSDEAGFIEQVTADIRRLL